MDDRQNSGRRSGDALFSRGVKIAGSIGGFAVVAITLAFKLYAQAQDFPAVKDRVSALESHEIAREARDAVQLMMTCVMYQDGHPTTVPALCDQAIRRAPR